MSTQMTLEEMNNSIKENFDSLSETIEQQQEEINKLKSMIFEIYAQIIISKCSECEYNNGIICAKHSMNC